MTAILSDASTPILAIRAVVAGTAPATEKARERVLVPLVTPRNRRRCKSSLQRPEAPCGEDGFDLEDERLRLAAPPNKVAGKGLRGESSPEILMSPSGGAPRPHPLLVQEPRRFPGRGAAVDDEVRSPLYDGDLGRLGLQSDNIAVPDRSIPEGRWTANPASGLGRCLLTPFHLRCAKLLLVSGCRSHNRRDEHLVGRPKIEDTFESDDGNARLSQSLVYECEDVVVTPESGRVSC